MNEIMTPADHDAHEKWRVGVLYRGYRLYVDPDGETTIYTEERGKLRATRILSAESEEAAKKIIDEWMVAP